MSHKSQICLTYYVMAKISEQNLYRAVVKNFGLEILLVVSTTCIILDRIFNDKLLFIRVPQNVSFWLLYAIETITMDQFKVYLRKSPKRRDLYNGCLQSLSLIFVIVYSSILL